MTMRNLSKKMSKFVFHNVDLMRQLKKKVMKEGILKEIKMRQYYEKPTLKRQRKAKEGLKRINKLKRQQEKFL